MSEFEKPLILCTTWFHASMKFSKMDNIRHSRVAIIWYYQCIIWNIDDMNFKIKPWLHSEGLRRIKIYTIHIYVSRILQTKWIQNTSYMQVTLFRILMGLCTKVNDWNVAFNASYYEKNLNLQPSCFRLTTHIHHTSSVRNSSCLVVIVKYFSSLLFIASLLIFIFHWSENSGCKKTKSALCSSKSKREAF